MAQIIVKRKAYTRKSGIKVKASTFKVEDKGKLGKTPERERWYAPTTKMNWRKTDPATTRKRNALKAHGGDKLATARALQALSNVSIDGTTKRLAKQDANYFFDLHRKEKK